MSDTNTAVAVYNHHDQAEAAIKKLESAGFNMKRLSIVSSRPSRRIREGAKMSLTHRCYPVHMLPPRGTAALAAVLLVSLATTARSQYHVSGGIGEFDDGGSGNSISLGSYDRQGAIQQGGGVKFDQNGDTANQIPALHSQANSLGNITGLRAHAYAQIIKPFQSGIDIDPFQHRYGIFADGSAIGDYSVTVSNPNVAPGTPVSTFYTVHLHGETIQGAGNTPDTINMSRADAGAQASIRGIVNGVYGPPAGGSFNRQVNNGTETQTGSGVLLNFVNDADFSTAPFTVINGQPFTVEMFLQASATAIGDFRESFTAEANSDFGGTLTFATDRPVFDLPAGYTANSVDGGIVNNVFVAPEPGGILFCGVALLIFVHRSRETRATSGHARQ